ncbi:MAG: undecaprenyl-diphosphate phosphatase [Patescibacteria group bacterium]
MDYLHSVILGVVEGITEFLPVSSTFHLLWTAKLLSIPQSDFVKLFEVFIQAGAVFSLIFVFQKEVWFNKKLYLKLIISTMPILIVGFLMRDIIKGVFFENVSNLTYIFMGVGLIFILLEWYTSKHTYRLQRGLTDISYKDALIAGIFQMFAVIPGVSRSGSVLVGMILSNFKREDAASYSLALSLPTIFAATAYDLYKNKDLLMSSTATSQIDILIVGFIVSFIVAYFAAKWLVKFLQKHTLLTFGIYRLIAGIILLAIGFVLKP